MFTTLMTTITDAVLLLLLLLLRLARWLLAFLFLQVSRRGRQSGAAFAAFCSAASLAACLLLPPGESQKALVLAVLPAAFLPLCSAAPAASASFLFFFPLAPLPWHWP